mgnify:CR=1 FL=1
MINEILTHNGYGHLERFLSYCCQPKSFLAPSLAIDLGVDPTSLERVTCYQIYGKKTLCVLHCKSFLGGGTWQDSQNQHEQRFAHKLDHELFWKVGTPKISVMPN